MWDLFDLKSDYQIKKPKSTIQQQLLLNALFRKGTPFLKLLCITLTSSLVMILNHSIKQKKKVGMDNRNF